MTFFVVNIKLAVFLFYKLMFCTTSLYRLALGAVPVTQPPPPVFITITLTRETADGIHLSWKSSAFSKNVLGTCTFYYGNGANYNSTQIHFSPEQEEIIVRDVEARVMYRGFITCQNGRFILPSNTVQFTSKRSHHGTHFSNPLVPILPIIRERPPPTSTPKTIIREEKMRTKTDEVISRTIGKERTGPPIRKHPLEKSPFAVLSTSFPSFVSSSLLPPFPSSEIFPQSSSSFDRRIQDESAMFSRTISGVPKLGPSRHFGGIAAPSLQDADEVSVVIMSQRHMNDPRTDPHNSTPSTSVILGVICGVVGFIIINVTVVIVVRQYSLRRDRQRRLFELQLEQHGGYIYNIEDILNA